MRHFKSGPQILSVCRLGNSNAVHNVQNVQYKCYLYFCHSDTSGWVRERFSLPLIQVITRTADTRGVLNRTHHKPPHYHQDDRYPRTMLDFAAFQGNMEVVLLLLSAGADVNCSSGFPLRVCADRESTGKITQVLMSAGADIDLYYDRDGRHPRGMTALESAVWMRNDTVARMLIHSGATYHEDAYLLDSLSKAHYKWIMTTINKRTRHE